MYSPTCSLYGLRAIFKYGPLWGGGRAWHRIRRCDAMRSLGGQDEP
ncbi:membrane protein insertion efficiency factor YidD [Myxococcus sp. 1LA]